VEGRKHIDVQTELYLEELSDRVEEADVEIQTDAFLDRPPSPMFVPAKTGKDFATQILDGDVSHCMFYNVWVVIKQLSYFMCLCLVSKDVPNEKLKLKITNVN